MNNDSNTMKLNKIALGVSLGFIWAISTLIMGLFATYCEYGDGFVKSLGEVYVGYEASLSGSFLGALWAFIDMFIGGYLIALIYNCVSCCCCKKRCLKADTTQDK